MLFLTAELSKEPSRVHFVLMMSLLNIILQSLVPLTYFLPQSLLPFHLGALIWQRVFSVTQFTRGVLNHFESCRIQRMQIVWSVFYQWEFLCEAFLRNWISATNCVTDTVRNWRACHTLCFVNICCCLLVDGVNYRSAFPFVNDWMFSTWHQNCRNYYLTWHCSAMMLVCTEGNCSVLCNLLSSIISDTYNLSDLNLLMFVNLATVK